MRLIAHKLNAVDTLKFLADKMASVSLDEAIRLGVEAQQSGRVRDALRFYSEVLKMHPEHPEANHNMGVLAVGFGKAEEALIYFKTALKGKPAISLYWLSYIDALICNDNLRLACLYTSQKIGLEDPAFDQLKPLCMMKDI